MAHIDRKNERPTTHETTRRANNAKSKIRSRVEHVFAEQKDRMELFIRTIGIARATTKTGILRREIQARPRRLRNPASTMPA